jgi:FAD/FMN-containing dehydrogenase
MAFRETKDLILINLSNLHSVVVAADKKSAVIGGGVKVHEAIAAADAADVVVFTGNCNSVGALGAFLGGGYGNLQGTVGLGVDNILALRVVTADGKLRTVSPSQDEDLFWAMRGAGPNFGIVTSATVKAYPMLKRDRVAFSGALIYTDDKLEQIVQAFQDLELTAQTVCFMYFGSGGPPAHTPMIVVTVWQLHGTIESGKAAFKSLIDIGPMVDTTAVVPYTEWNTGANAVCLHAGRKPTFTAGLDHLDPQAWRDVWNKYVEFQKKPTAHDSVVLLENYPMSETHAANRTSAAFPHRAIRFNAAAIPWYTDNGLDDEGARCGQEIRELWKSSSGRDVNAS